MIPPLRLTLALLSLATITHAQDNSSQPATSATNLSTVANATPQAPANLRPFRLTLPQDHLFGDWYGVRPKLEKLGIDLNFNYVSDIAGNPSGGKSQGITHADNFGLDMHFDLEKLIGLEGGSFLVSLSQRDGNSLSKDRVGNDFTIQQVYGGNTFKLVDVAYLQKLMDHRLEIRLGRIAAGDDFLVSPYDYLFMQNGFDGNPVGIFFNSPGMTAYPNSGWGALLKVRPTPRTYIMGGVYQSDPEDREIAHNGADMSFNAPLFAIGEAGYQHNGLPGDSRFLGNYKIGAWYDNSSFTDYNTAGYATPSEMKRGNWGLYAMFDQVVFPFGKPDSDHGFGVFGSFLASPDQSVSQIPYFVATGMACRGILPSRPGDGLGFGILYGDFSSALRHSEEREEFLVPATTAQDYEAVAECTYKFYYRRRSLFIQPDFQYIMRPAGTGKITDAVVLGCQIGINF